MSAIFDQKVIVFSSGYTSIKDTVNGSKRYNGRYKI